MSTNRYDVIVVGSGASGGMAARCLTEAGVRVLVLEAGKSFWPLELPCDAGDGQDEDKPADAASQPIQSRCADYNPLTARLFVNDADHPYTSTHPYYWIRARAVGGRTLLWSRGTVRLTAADLTASKDGHGVSWPLRPEDLEPHYDRAERFLRVIGSPTGSPSRPMTTEELRFKAALESRWPERRVSVFPVADPLPPGQPFDLEEFMRNEAHRGESVPSYDASVWCLLHPAARTGRLTLRSNAIVRRVLSDSTGTRAAGVEFIDRNSKRVHTAEAQVVLLCASTLETTRILLNSAPGGLANSSGVLGRYLTDKIYGVYVRAVPRSRPNLLDAPLPPLLVSPFRRPTARSLRRHLLILERVDRDDATEAAGWQWSTPGRRPQQSGETMLQIAAFGEALAFERNGVSLDESVVDAWGIPALRIDHQRAENDLLMARDILDSQMEAADIAGFDVTHSRAEPLAPGMAIHEVGTARMGDDPKSSVVNSFGQSWDLPNLFIGDGAVFPSAPCQNPTLTMMAIASRTSDHIAKQIRNGAQ